MRISHSRITRALSTGLLSFGLVACGLVASSMGQDDAKKDAALKEMVVKALGQLEKKDVALTGTIEKEEADVDATAAGTPGQMMERVMFGQSGLSERPFYGDVDILASKTQEVVMVSKTDLPGLKVYAKGEDYVHVQATSEGTFRVKNLAPVIEKLVSWVELAKAVEGSNQIRSSTRGSVMEVRVDLDPKYFPSGSPEQSTEGGEAGAFRFQFSGMGMDMKAKSLSVIFTLTEKRELVGILYTVDLSPPESPMVMVQRAMPAIRIQPAQAAQGLDIRIVGEPDEAEAKDNSDEPKDVEVGAAQVAGAAQVVVGRAVPAGAPAGVAQIAVQGMPLPPMAGAGQGEVILYDFQVQPAPSPRTTSFLEEGRKLLRSRQ